MLRFLGILLSLTLFSVSTYGAEGEVETILCEEQGLSNTVEKLPALADQWMTVVCTPSGQALMPKMENQYVWVAHNTTSPFLVRSIPEGANVPSVPEMQASELLRFTKFTGVEMSGTKSDMAMNLLKAALGGTPPPSIDAVYQLDAQSTYQGMMTNLFIYRANGEPKIMVACRARCQSSAVIDVTTFDELTTTIENSDR